MATDVAIPGHKALLYTGASATASAGDISTLVGKVGDLLNGPNLTVTPIDVTNRDSTDEYMEVLPGRKDAGVIGFDLVCEEDEITLMKSYIEADALRSWKILFETSGATWHSAGMLQSFAQDFDPASPVNASCEIKLSGKPTFTETA